MIKTAIVGFGMSAKTFHIPFIKQSPDYELVAISTSHIAGATVAFPRASVHESALEMITSTDADLIIITAPNDVHYNLAHACLMANKHVVVEKPMGLTKESCERVIYTALQMNRQVFCVMQNRYSPPSEWIKSVVEDGILGNIFMVQVNCYWNRDERYYKQGGWKGTSDLDGGTLFTQFSHFIDIMYWLFGDIDQIQGKFADFNHKDSTDFEDSGFVSFKFLNGGMGCINYSTAVANQNLESSLTIIGSKGSVKIGGQYMNIVEHCNIKNYQMPILAETAAGNHYGAYTGSAQNHHLVIENVMRVLNGGENLGSTAEEGSKVVATINKMYDAGK